MRLLLYALVAPSRREPRLRGLRGEPLRVVAAAGVGALIGIVPSPPKPTAPTLRAYHDVMLEVSQRYGATVPARFGTMLVDREELAFILRSRAASFRRLLAGVRGRVQMTVRFVESADAGASHADAEDRTSGAAYLHARAAASRRLRQSAACVALRRRVRRWIRNERIERQHRVTTVYHLVPRGVADRYRRAVVSVAEMGGLRPHVSGPFPPFAFSDPLDVGTAATTPAPRPSTRAGRHG